MAKSSAHPRSRAISPTNVAHEERRKLLVNELNHRVKNTLATVQSLAAQTFRGETHTPVFRQFESRLVALSRAHDALTREDWEGIYLQDLIVEAIAPICIQPERRFQISGPSLRFGQSSPFRYPWRSMSFAPTRQSTALLQTRRDASEFDWEVHETSPERCLHLRWEETGGPEVETPRRKGFGSRLLELALRREFDAQVALSFAPSGVVCEIKVPIT